MQNWVRQQNVVEVVRTALECSVYLAPTAPGLAHDEVLEVGRRLGFQEGEVQDAISSAAGPICWGDTKLLPQKKVLWSQFNLFLEDPDYRNPQAFDFVSKELISAVRSVGARNAHMDREVLVAKAAVPSAASPFSPVSRTPSPAFTMADLRVHDDRSSRSRWPIFAFTMTDLAVHDGPILAFTMVRNSQSVASSADGTKLVAATDDWMTTGGYIYTSSDSGATWTQTGAQQYWTSVASSADGTKLVAVSSDNVTQDGGSVERYIYTSVGSGATWTQTGTAQEWRSVASSSDGTKLVAVVNFGYIHTSSDSGATWTQTGTPQEWRSVVSSADGTKLVAVAGGDGYAGYVYTSSDSGATWTQTGLWQEWNSVASSADGTKLVAVTYCDDGYIYTSGDSGTTWTQTSSLQGCWYSVASSEVGPVEVGPVEVGPAEVGLAKV